MKDTTDESMGFGLFCSRFNGQVFSVIGFPVSSTWMFPVGISSDSLCILTFDSRILLSVPNRTIKRVTVDLLQVVSYLYPILSLIPFLSLISPDLFSLPLLELIVLQAAVTDLVRNYVVSMVVLPLLMEVFYLEMA